MDICYVDESGSSDTLCEAIPDSTPILVTVGLFVPDGHMKSLIWEFLQLKKDFCPHLQADGTQLSDLIKYEIKGADLRSDIRSGSRDRKRRAIGILDRVFTILDRHQCRIVARVLVKTTDARVDDRATYGSMVGWICRTFHRYLEERDEHGLVILDSRTKVKNTGNSDVITTQIFRHGGDPFARFVEVPLFGHSDSHVVLQMADVVASAVVFPSSCAAFCGHLHWNHHSHEKYDEIRIRFGSRLKAAQFRFFDETSAQWRGGVYANGNLAAGHGARQIFGIANQTARLPGIIEQVDAELDGAAGSA
jgi:Protein of unknown function (DUF3800)